MNSRDILKELKSKANPRNVEGMARFGISKKGTLGVAIPDIRRIAKRIGKNHGLSKELWVSGIHEARILAGLIADPALMSERQMGKWAQDFDSWDVCDQVSCNLFDKTKFAYKKVFEWARRREEFVKRTAFTLIACLASHDRTAKDEKFLKFFPLIKAAAIDERNFVKKAVNWALRGIGKRNIALNKAAIKLARLMLASPRAKTSKSLRWVAAGALSELESQAVQKRLRSRATGKV